MPKLSLRLGFSITLSTCLLGSMPLVVYAGDTDVTGGGAATSDQFFSNTPQAISVPTSDAQGLNVNPDGISGVESVSVETADKVTIIVREIQKLSETFTVKVGEQSIKLPADIINQVLMAMGDDADSAAFLEDRITSQVTQNQDISPEAISSITSSISTLITAARTIFNLTITPITESDAEADLIPVKNLEIDPNQLNDAILAYNKVILEADEEGLIALSNIPEFLAIGEIMRQFRAAFATSAGGEDGEGG